MVMVLRLAVCEQGSVKAGVFGTLSGSLQCEQETDVADTTKVVAVLRSFTD